MQKWRRPYYRRLTIFFLVLVITVLTISWVVLYRQVAAERERQIYSSASDSLARSTAGMDLIMRQACALLTRIAEDPSYVEIMYRSTGVYQQWQAAQHLANELSPFPWIESIYLYNRGTHQLIRGPASGDPVRYDPGALRLIRSLQPEEVLTPLPRRACTSLGDRIAGRPPRNVLTLVYTTDRLNQDGPHGAVMLNIHEDSLRASLLAISRQSKQTLMMLDRQGRVLIHPDPRMFGRGLAKQDYIASILRAATMEPRRNSFRARVNGHPTLVVYQPGDVAGGYLVSLIPYREITQQAFLLSRATVVAALILLLLALLAAILVGNAAYAPLDRVLQAIRKRVDDRVAEPAAPGELEFLMESFSRMLEQVNQLETTEQDRRHTAVLKDLLLGLDFHDLEDIGLDAVLRPAESYAAVVFCLDSLGRLRREYNDESLSLFRRAVTSLAGDYLGCEAPYLVLDLGADQCVAVAAVNGEWEDLRTRLVKAIQSMRLALPMMGVSFTVGIGQPVRTLMEIRGSYLKAYDAVQCRLFHGHGATILYDRLITTDDNTIVSVEEHEKLILNALRLGRLDKAEQALDRFLASLAACPYTRARFLIIQLALGCATTLMRPAEQGGLGLSGRLKLASEDPSKMETLDEVREWFLASFIEALAKINGRVPDYGSLRVNKTLQLIEANHADPNLTPETLARQVGVTPRYLRKLFQAEGRQPIAETIQAVRFTAARDFLLSTELSVAEVAVRIGFIDANYFCTAFRKHHGLSPTQYRREARLRGPEAPSFYNPS